MPSDIPQNLDIIYSSSKVSSLNTKAFALV